MDQNERRRREAFLKTQEPFRSNAVKIIKKMLDLCNQIPGSKHLVDEILHSIFFLGKINTVPFTPESIITDEEMMDSLKERFPKPFNCYSSQLPKRSPFSCVLDMIVLLKGQDHVDDIKQSLRDLVKDLNKEFLVSSTMCVTTSKKKYYGVSMSTTRPNPGKIVIAASCCSAWDEYVAGAVMTYYPEKANLPYEKKSYFDGTIKLPKKVRCEAFNIKNGTDMHPCRSCGNLFGLDTDEEKEWPYGNCAEVESLSNLFKNEEDIKNEAQPTSPTYTAENRERAKQSVLDVLRQVLKMVKFKWEEGRFYDPQTEWY